MAKAEKITQNRTRATIGLVASIMVGLTFILSGSGKVLAFGEMPGQTMQFIGAILPDAWLTPGIAYFMSEILFPIILPCIELGLGIMLLLRIWPRFFAALVLPLTLAFMTNNIWYITHGELKFTECDCFGIWKIFLGSFTHVESLYLDIILFVLALTIVLVQPGEFFASPPWLPKSKKGTVKVNK
ncbi:MAG TPA: MauE/DoxX family redox-associated membrane protein [Dehalococcoidia bacterium]|jgi:uncharacterized membrane protein YphA (DoxX/SURF4 family)